MNYGPDPEPTPLRSRLGPHADDLWRRQIGGPADEDVFGPPIESSVTQPADVGSPVAPAIEKTEKLNAVVAAPAPASPRRAELDSAIEQTGGRVGQWISDQQQRLAVGLDLLLTQLNEQRAEELARLQAWEASERRRVETELAAEQDHFHEKLLAELKAFEEQLALRLAEQEERLARWLAEAEQQTEQRFAAHRAQIGSAERTAADQ